MIPQTQRKKKQKMNKKIFISLSCLGAIALSFFATSKAYSLYINKDNNIEIKLGIVAQSEKYYLTDGDSINYELSKENENKYYSALVNIPMGKDLYIKDQNGNTLTNYNPALGFHFAYNSSAYRTFIDGYYDFTITRENESSPWYVNVAETVSTVVVCSNGTNDSKYDNPNIHMWGGTHEGTAWPGVSMTPWYKNEFNQQVSYIAFHENEYKSIIFNKEGVQTEDIKLTDGNTESYYRYYLSGVNDGRFTYGTW